MKRGSVMAWTLNPEADLIIQALAQQLVTGRRAPGGKGAA
jgi:hypothetical protein